MFVSTFLNRAKDSSFLSPRNLFGPYCRLLSQFGGNHLGLGLSNPNPDFKSPIYFSLQLKDNRSTKYWVTFVLGLCSKSIGTNFRQFATMSDSEDKKAELKERLTPLQYHITQEKGTERAFTGKYNKCYDTGMYSCVVCDQPLFASQTKFDSGCGWPAFNDVLDQGKVKLTKDTSHGMVRTEVTCAQCNAHLGHVFGDGPAPTRKRFCINSASLQFHPAEGSQDSSNT